MNVTSETALDDTVHEASDFHPTQAQTQTPTETQAATQRRSLSGMSKSLSERQGRTDRSLTHLDRTADTQQAVSSLLLLQSSSTKKKKPVDMDTTWSDDEGAAPVSLAAPASGRSGSSDQPQQNKSSSVQGKSAAKKPRKEFVDPYENYGQNQGQTAGQPTATDPQPPSLPLPVPLPMPTGLNKVPNPRQTALGAIPKEATGRLVLKYGRPSLAGKGSAARLSTGTAEGGDSPRSVALTSSSRKRSLFSDSDEEDVDVPEDSARATRASSTATPYANNNDNNNNNRSNYSSGGKGRLVKNGRSSSVRNRGHQEGSGDLVSFGTQCSQSLSPLL